MLAVRARHEVAALVRRLVFALNPGIPWIVGVEPSRTFERHEKVRVRASASAIGSPSSSAEGG
jgi:hypothetical protein